MNAAVSVGVAGALAGCPGISVTPAPPPAPDPLEPLLRSTQALAARYETTLSTHPELTERLGPLHAAHIAHVAALLALIGRQPISPSADPSSAATLSPPVDGDAEATVAALREAEQEAQYEAAEACLAASAEQAPVLGSISAARASHARVLR